MPCLDMNMNKSQWNLRTTNKHNSPKLVNSNEIASGEKKKKKMLQCLLLSVMQLYTCHTPDSEHCSSQTGFTSNIGMFSEIAG